MVFGNHVPSTARADLTGYKVELPLGARSKHILMPLQELEDIFLLALFEEAHAGTIVSVRGRGQ